jgi:hypothetical protein
MANQNEEKYQEIIYLRKSMPSPNGIIMGHSYDLIDNEPYIIYFRKLQDYEVYSEMDYTEQKQFLKPYLKIAYQKKYQEEQKRRLTYNPNFDYRMRIRETSEKFTEILKTGRRDTPEGQVLHQHFYYLIKQQKRQKKVCRHCLKVLDYNYYMGNTGRGYRVCMQCKNFIPQFRR